METAQYEVLRTFEHGGLKHAGQEIPIEVGFGERLASRGFVRRLDPLPPGAQTPEDKLPAPTSPESALLAEWAETGLKSSPAVYLKRSPTGPHSDLAQRLVAAGHGAG